jgi:pimeloyl-ACP methyl ester carboxylesterase
MEPPRTAEPPAGAGTVAPPAAPAPDRDVEPEGYVVLVGERDRIHFLDWGGPGDARAGAGPAIVLLHGLGSTAWSWAPVARRLRQVRRVVAVDLRGHGLSDAADDGYDEATLAEDVVAAAEGSGALGGSGPASAGADGRVVLAGHGFGAIVAAWAASSLGARCAGLVLVDGGWERPTEAVGLDPEELLRAIEEPPEVMRSLAAFLADRKAFDPSTWDADQERAARATVVELPVGRVVPSIHDHVRAACVGAMDAYDPVATLVEVTAPVTILAAADDETGTHGRTLAATIVGLTRAGRPGPRVVRFPGDGHNLMRYRPAETTAAILATHLEESPR